MHTPDMDGHKDTGSKGAYPSGISLYQLAGTEKTIVEAVL